MFSGGQLPFAWSRPYSCWKEQGFVSEGLHGNSGGPGASEGEEEVSERVLHASIAIDPATFPAGS